MEESNLVEIEKFMAAMKKSGTYTLTRESADDSLMFVAADSKTWRATDKRLAGWMANGSLGSFSGRMEAIDAILEADDFLEKLYLIFEVTWFLTKRSSGQCFVEFKLVVNNVARPNPDMKPLIDDDDDGIKVEITGATPSGEEMPVIQTTPDELAAAADAISHGNS